MKPEDRLKAIHWSLWISMVTNWAMFLLLAASIHG